MVDKYIKRYVKAQQNKHSQIPEIEYKCKAMDRGKSHTHSVSRHQCKLKKPNVHLSKI